MLALECHGFRRANKMLGVNHIYMYIVYFLFAFGHVNLYFIFYFGRIYIEDCVSELYLIFKSPGYFYTLLILYAINKCWSSFIRKNLKKKRIPESSSVPQNLSFMTTNLLLCYSWTWVIQLLIYQTNCVFMNLLLTSENILQWNKWSFYFFIFF